MNCLVVVVVVVIWKDLYMYIYICIVMTPLHTHISETYKIVNWSMILWCFFCCWYLLLLLCVVLCCPAGFPGFSLSSINSFFFSWYVDTWYSRSGIRSVWCGWSVWTQHGIYIQCYYMLWIYPNKVHENREMCTNMYCM